MMAKKIPSGEGSYLDRISLTTSNNSFIPIPFASGAIIIGISSPTVLPALYNVQAVGVGSHLIFTLHPGYISPSIMFIYFAISAVLETFIRLSIDALPEYAIAHNAGSISKMADMANCSATLGSISPSTITESNLNASLITSPNVVFMSSQSGICIVSSVVPMISPPPHIVIE